MNDRTAGDDGTDDDWADLPFTRGRAADARAPLLLRPVDARRARRHPWTIFGLWAWQAAVGLAAAWPAAALVGGVYGASTRGDAALWDPGGHALLDFLWHNAHALAPITAVAEIALGVGAVAGLVPTAAAMVTMARVARSRDGVTVLQSLSAALWLLPSFLFLFVVFSVAEGLTLGLGVGLGELVRIWTQAGLGDVRAQRIGISVGVIFALLASGLAVVHDLARAVVVCVRAPAPRAIGLGARAFGAAPLPLWWSWAWRWVASLVPVSAVAVLTGQVGGRGGAALALVAMMHQSVIVSRVSLRASWLARALRAMDD